MHFKTLFSAGLALSLLAGTQAQAVLVDFQDYSFANDSPVDAAYQPVPDVTIDWGGWRIWDGIDHDEGFTGGDPSAWSLYNEEGGTTMSFDTPVYVSSLFVGPAWGDQSEVTVSGLDSGDNVVWTQTLTDLDSIEDGGSFQEITGSASNGISSLQLSFPTEGTGIHMDHINVSAVPEPASLALMGLGGLAMLSRRRRR